ncbi:hypothetical protein D3C80_1889050 [compost metagenome]
MGSAVTDNLGIHLSHFKALFGKITGNRADPVPDQEHVLKQRPVELHKVNHRPGVFKHDPLRLLQVKRTLDGFSRELENTEASLFTI